MPELLDQLTVDELAAAIDAGDDLTVVDTRPPESFDAWHVPGAVNVPYHPVEGLGNGIDWDDVAEIVEGRSVAVICGKGLSSTSFGFELSTRGFDVQVVKGGMEDWSKLYDVVEVETDGDLYLAQIQRRAKGCLGYVVGDREAGEALVVDATRQHHEFELVAADNGMVITGVLDTHVHADHVSGGRALAERLSVPYYLSADADERGVAYDYEPLADGEALSVGDVDAEVLAAPGHTTELVNLLVDDTYLLSADTLFVESVGRTELEFGEEGAEHGARLLYETIHDRYDPLGDDVVVLPGHVSVDADGRFGVGGPGELIAATLGDLRSELDLFALDEAAFVERLTGEGTEKPPNYETVIDVNRGTAELDENEATEVELGPNNCAA
ncbi:MBL fold metallo-hydrolase [Halobellus rarus]|uniref:Rhodanese-like domain-containing protein n=1 Tax=Halobellus rarus TaxID=1126237 RepID=A0ABD6CNE7_9EURY|nr:rhodanese-like domain-containing protein [Halobellus rarus]